MLSDLIIWPLLAEYYEYFKYKKLEFSLISDAQSVAECGAPEIGYFFSLDSRGLTHKSSIFPYKPI
jgi:hypothetical protein